MQQRAVNSKNSVHPSSLKYIYSELAWTSLFSSSDGALLQVLESLARSWVDKAVEIDAATARVAVREDCEAVEAHHLVALGTLAVLLVQVLLGNWRSARRTPP